MDKKEKTITASRKKICIVSVVVTLITSLLYALLFAYGTKDILLDYKVSVENSYFFKSFIIMWPILIILIGTAIAATFVFIKEKKNK